MASPFDSDVLESDGLRFLSVAHESSPQNTRAPNP
jgi:hypothetical protein